MCGITVNEMDQPGEHEAAHCQFTSCLNQHLMKYSSMVDVENTAVNAYNK